MALWYGALGPQVVDSAAPAAFDLKPGELTYGQLSPAMGASDGFHGQPLQSAPPVDRWQGPGLNRSVVAGKGGRRC